MATINDVARAAGVSTSTVSYVLSGKRSISAETRARVEEAIRQLDYRPHAGARSLASRRTWTLALVAPLRTDVNVGVIMKFVTGVATRARDHEMDVLLLTQDDPRGVERAATSSMVDALIMMDIEAEDPRIPTLVELHRPAVLIGLPDDPRGLSVVDLDFEAAGRMAMQHLLDLGHTEVALIGPTPTVLGRHTSYAERLLRGYRSCAEAAGTEPVVEPAEASHAGGADAVGRVLRRRPELTALVVHNEAALPGVLTALGEAGRPAGKAVSVIALCPADVAVGQQLPLTSIDLPAVRMGEIAVDLAMARIEGIEDPEIRLLVPQLTERDSTFRQP
ncbi:LacI family DNA-binding transcriptional regulator [Microlunatus parietis]|uniref:DNA-binding LacI/PurR family transcriptional regulator n=1 Tax=Microlunatus parietis TaxID=682979 RepID=A0A7Y9ICT5_9ACTN|nr:LacI family DNA-binding transcriptional regulator [Microlunatus parietis]NYE74450.1 DNA-binding LacI/PurR family transcriptional regulator [Microlunatus parietis]